jgi:hypothetical protein
MGLVIDEMSVTVAVEAEKVTQRNGERSHDWTRPRGKERFLLLNIDADGELCVTAMGAHRGRSANWRMPFVFTLSYDKRAIINGTLHTFLARRRRLSPRPSRWIFVDRPL